MIEAHAHLAALGLSLTIPSLAACASLDEALDIVRSHARTSTPGSWLRFTSARPEAWPERRWPTLAEIDGASPALPVVIMSFDHHAAVANSRALHAANLQPAQRIVPHDEVVADPITNAPTGLLRERAAYAAWNAAPEPTSDQRASHLQSALNQLASRGYSEVHDLHAQPWLGPALADLQRRGHLPLAVRLYPALAHLPSLHASRATWESAELSLAGGKLFADGTLNARTAHVLHPFRQPAIGIPPNGSALLTTDQLRHAIKLTESFNLHLAVHAIGDAAVRSALDAIESASRLPPHSPALADQPATNRHRIEHCELIDQADVPRFARLGVVCSVQPCHLLTDIEVLSRQLPHRLDRVLPLRELIDSGCRPQAADRRGLLWFGSDVPIVPANPLDSIQAAVLRRRAGTPEHDAIALSQRILESEAWACFAGVPHAR